MNFDSTPHYSAMGETGPMDIVQNNALSEHTAFTNHSTSDEVHEDESSLESDDDDDDESSISKGPFPTLAHAILPELPFLMHGSGDVLPHEVDPSSVAILAQLIEKYIASLVSAAMEAHDIFTDGEVVGGGGCLPPPPFRTDGAWNGNDWNERSSDSDESDSDDDSDDDSSEDEESREGSTNEDYSTRRKRRSREDEIIESRKLQKRIDYWDEPLPPPYESEDDEDGSGSDSDEINKDKNDIGQKGNSKENTAPSDDSADSDDDAPLLASRVGKNVRPRSSPVTVSQPQPAPKPKPVIPPPKVEEDESSEGSWEGVLPVDLHSNQRTRNFYVTAPTAMDARSFIFPICHDAVLYQRVKEVQASRRAIGRELVDNHCWMEMVKEEGGEVARMGMVDMWDAVLGGGGHEEKEELNGRSSPTKDKSESDTTLKREDEGGGKDEDNDGDKPTHKEINKGEEEEEKKKERSDSIKEDKDYWKYMVSAGLVDSEGVNASWPGLQALSRGTLR